MFYYVAYLIVKIYARLLCRKQVTGREHVPDKGPFLVVANHLSSMDPPVIVDMIPIRLRMVGMAALAHRSDFLIGWFMDRAGAIWVRRGQSDRRALSEALDTLSSGRPLGVAPEGTRSKTGGLIEGKTGVTFLALKAQVPVLPIALAGSDQVFPSLKRLRRATVAVRIGPVFSLPPKGDGERREHVQYCTDLIMTRLASMLPESYQGVYAGHPLITYWRELDASGSAARPQWLLVTDL